MGRQFHALCLVGGLALTGCGATLTQLRTRASVDLGCAPETIRTEPLDGATQIAKGCGKRAIYVEIFNNSRYPTWLLNSSVEPAADHSALQSMR